MDSAKLKYLKTTFYKFNFDEFYSLKKIANM